MSIFLLVEPPEKSVKLNSEITYWFSCPVVLWRKNCYDNPQLTKTLALRGKKKLGKKSNPGFHNV